MISYKVCCTMLLCLNPVAVAATAADDVVGDRRVADLAQVVESLEYAKPSADERDAENQTRLVVAAFSPTGKFLVLGTEGGRVIVWNMNAGRLQFTTKGHDKPVKCIDFGDDDRYALTAADDLRVRLWNVAAGESNLSFKGAPLRQIYEVQLGPKAAFAASRGFDGFGVLWDLRTNREITSLFSYGFEFSPNGKLFATTAQHRRPSGLSIIRLPAPKESHNLAENDSVTSIAFDPSGRLVATVLSSSERPSKVLLWEVDSWRKVWEFDFPAPEGTDENPVASSLAFSADGSALVVGFSRGRIAQIDVATARTARTWQFPRESHVSNAQFVGANDRYLLAHGFGEDSSSSTTLWKSDAAKPLWQIPGYVTMDEDRMLGANITPTRDILLLGAVRGEKLLQLRGFQGGTRWMPVGRKVAP